MSPARRKPCARAEALARHRQANAYLETAHLVTSEGTLPQDYDYNHVAAGVAILAAVAASDALCCALLGERSRGSDHREAVALLATIRYGSGTPEGQAKVARGLSAALASALDLKDQAHYGTALLGRSEVKRIIKAAEKLVAASSTVLRP
jgi:hypothetical protein